MTCLIRSRVLGLWYLLAPRQGRGAGWQSPGQVICEGKFGFQNKAVGKSLWPKSQSLGVRPTKKHLGWEDQQLAGPRCQGWLHTSRYARTSLQQLSPLPPAPSNLPSARTTASTPADWVSEFKTLWVSLKLQLLVLKQSWSTYCGI